MARGLRREAFDRSSYEYWAQQFGANPDASSPASAFAQGPLDLAIDLKRDFGASGSSATTTGNMIAGSNILTLATAEDFKDGQGISVAGAGASGTPLVSTIVSGAGSTILTLADMAGTTVSGATVRHDDTYAMQAALQSSSGGTLIIPSGVFNVNFNALPAITSNVRLVGQPGSVISVTEGNQVNAGDPYFVNCIFEDLTFDGTLLSIGIPFVTGCTRLTFVRCVIQNFPGAFLTQTGPDISFVKCRWCAVNGYSKMWGFIGNVSENFMVEGCEFNFAPASTSNSMIALNLSTGLLGNVWIKNNRFFDNNQPGYTLDAAIDIEPGSTQAMENVQIEGNIVYNSKIFVSAVNQIWIRRNVLRFTEVGYNASSIAWAIAVKTTNNTTPIGIVDISDNDIIEDDASVSCESQPINVEPSGWTGLVRIANNRITVNGSSTNTTFAAFPFAAIAINTDQGGYIDRVDIMNNAIYYTAAPSSPQPAIVVHSSGSSAYVANVSVVGNVFGGVSGAISSAVYTIYGSGSPGLTVCKIVDNDATAASPTQGFISGIGEPVYPLVQNNLGYNPIGFITAPAMPASGAAYQWKGIFRVRIFISGGSVSDVSINGISTGLTGGTFLLNYNDTITLTYTSAPAWVWFGE